MQILVVNTSLDWSSRNPQFDDRRLSRLLVDGGHDAHDVPIPFVGAAANAALALGLLPYAAYGDVFLGLGHRAAFVNHGRKIIVVDEEIMDGVVGLTAANHDRLGKALRGCDEVVATTALTAAHLAASASVGARVVSDVRDLLSSFDGDR